MFFWAGQNNYNTAADFGVLWFELFEFSYLYCPDNLFTQILRIFKLFLFWQCIVTISKICKTTIVFSETEVGRFCRNCSGHVVSHSKLRFNFSSLWKHAVVFFCITFISSLGIAWPDLATKLHPLNKEKEAWFVDSLNGRDKWTFKLVKVSIVRAVKLQNVYYFQSNRCLCNFSHHKIFLQTCVYLQFAIGNSANSPTPTICRCRKKHMIFDCL